MSLYYKTENLACVSKVFTRVKECCLLVAAHCPSAGKEPAAKNTNSSVWKGLQKKKKKTPTADSLTNIVFKVILVYKEHYNKRL